jgi:N-acetylglucosaminyl-diphospho-decaprenol L-rhamnosyltransferase
MSLSVPREADRGITISIVTYNTWPTTKACIRSILADPPVDQPFEILVVDNGLPDGEPMPETMDHVSLYDSPVNLGYGRGHNHNLGRARYDRFLILNPDTVTTGAALQSLASVLDTHADIALVAPRLVLPDGRPQLALRSLPGLRTEFGRVFGLDERLDSPWSTLLTYAGGSTFQRVGQVAGAAMMFRTSDLRRLRGFDERFPMYFEDVDLCRRAAGLGAVVCHLGSSITHEGEGTAKSYRARAIYWVETSRMKYYSIHETGLRRLALSLLTFTSCLSHLAACIALMARASEADRA